MSKKTILLGISQAIIIFLISYILNISLALYLVGGIFILKALMVKFYHKKLDEFEKSLNRDRWNALNKKDKEFKSHFNRGSFGYIVIALIIFYVAYRFSLTYKQNMPIQYYLALPLFILVNLFGETLAIIKSKSIDHYRRLNIYVSITLVLIAIIIFQSAIFI